MKGKYYLSYSIDKKPKEIIVDVKLIMVDGKLNNNQNIYFGEVHVNGYKKEEYDLTTCVNAEYAAENIGLSLKETLILRATEDRLRFKILKEEIK